MNPIIIVNGEKIFEKLKETLAAYEPSIGKLHWQREESDTQLDTKKVLVLVTSSMTNILDVLNNLGVGPILVEVVKENKFLGLYEKVETDIITYNNFYKLVII